MNSIKKILAVVISLLLIGGLVFAFTSSEDPSPEPVVQTETQAEEVNETEQTAESTDEEPVTKDPVEPELIKTVTIVSERPVVATGFGNVSEKPLPIGQQTSTTCTTDARVECVVTFTNTASDQKIEFEPQETNVDGVAIWYWVGGENIGSGEWTVQAKAGDKLSNSSTVYVQ